MVKHANVNQPKKLHFGSEKDAATFGQININQNLPKL